MTIGDIPKGRFHMPSSRVWDHNSGPKTTFSYLTGDALLPRFHGSISRGENVPCDLL
jgi:hypothetical protein